MISSTLIVWMVVMISPVQLQNFIAVETLLFIHVIHKIRRIPISDLTELFYYTWRMSVLKIHFCLAMLEPCEKLENIVIVWKRIHMTLMRGKRLVKINVITPKHHDFLLVPFPPRSRNRNVTSCSGGQNIHPVKDCGLWCTSPLQFFLPSFANSGEVVWRTDCGTLKFACLNFEEAVHVHFGELLFSSKKLRWFPVSFRTGSLPPHPHPPLEGG